MSDIAMKIEGVNKTFRLPHEKRTSIKGSVIGLFRKQTFEKQQALKDISFEVKQGEFFGIVGRNGSGKSTLLKLLAGIYSPDKGLIQINGSLTPFIELGVGFSPELTGRENVFLNGALLGFSRKKMTAMYGDIVKFAELEKFMDQKLKNYSSGMQVRLAFSIAIRANSDILLLDEVLAVGDAAFQQKCFNHFEELKREKRTVVFVTHDMGAVRRFCNRAVYIKEGKITHQGAPSAIADVYTLENIQDLPNGMEKDLSLSTVHNISLKIQQQTDKNLVLSLSYKSRDKDEIYAAIGVIKDGISIAEIATPLDQHLVGDGKIIYSLDTSILNAGVYSVGASLFRMKNKELVAKEKNNPSFILKGEDMTKGAALKLPDSWKFN